MTNGDQPLLNEPMIRRIAWHNLSHANRHMGSGKEAALVRDILDLTDKFEPNSEHSSRRCFWISVTRGTPGDWMPLEEFREFAEDEGLETDDLEAERLRRWEKSFPEETYWHRLTCVREDDWMMVAIDSSILVEVHAGEMSPWDDPFIGECLLGLKPAVHAIVEMAKASEYENYLEANLPMHCRYGHASGEARGRGGEEGCVIIRALRV